MYLEQPTNHTRKMGISVLLATIGIDAWLDASVESLLRQGGVDFEVVVIHDGIKADHARSWTTDQRVRVVEIANRSGLANALNVGARSSKYEYLARLDADDIALPGRLRAQSDYLNAHPSVAVVGTRAEVIDENGRVTGRLGTSNHEDLRRSLLLRNLLIHPSVMFRFRPFADAGGYNANLRQMEDYDLWLRMALIGEVRVIDSEYVQYRVHSNQMSRSAKPFSTYTNAVLQARRALARDLGVSHTSQVGRDVAWSVAQALRYVGLRQAGYLMKASVAARLCAAMRARLTHS